MKSTRVLLEFIAGHSEGSFTDHIAANHEVLLPYIY